MCSIQKQIVDNTEKHFTDAFEETGKQNMECNVELTTLNRATIHGARNAPLMLRGEKLK